jgi:RNA 3'-terminal phosphate cyclase (ATP)
MLELDGSYGEGGGQILRTALALSAITNIPVRIYNIRKKRKNPGLAPQHLKATEVLVELTDAHVSGLEIGSTQLTFEPEHIKPCRKTIDIGTAGSITLLLQCIIPPLLYADEVSNFRVKGGTDVYWSPSWDYYQHITLRAMREMGIRVEGKLVRRGYYPRGGGEVEIIVYPSKPSPKKFERVNECVEGRVHSSKLPLHVPERIKRSAFEYLRESGMEASIEIEIGDALSPGCGITLWSGLIGSCVLGARGVPSEEVGRGAATHLLKELESGACVDVHLADQLILYMGLAGGGEFTTPELSGHTLTNIWVVEKFIETSFGVEQTNGLWKIYL